MWKHILALYQARDVLFTWTIREIKVRYTDTKLGLAWLILYPAGWVLMFTILFSRLNFGGKIGIPYPLLVLSGLAPWFFFSNTTSNAVSSLKNNSNLIIKVYFPREILPLGSVLVGFLDFSLYILLLILAMLYYRVGGGIQIVMLVPIVASLTALILAVSLFTSRMAPFYREVQLLIPLALQFLMYIVPVFYPIEIVPERFKVFYMLNPLASLMDAFRRTLILHSMPNWCSFCWAFTISFVLLFCAYWDFKRAEQEFADRL